MSERHPYGAVAYGEALAAADGQKALDVPEWRSAVIVRPAAAGALDATGPYPRAPLGADADLAGGLQRLRSAGLVSVVLVPDPLNAPAPKALAAAFPVFRPFKTHFIVDRRAGAYAPSKHHRYEIRRAAAGCVVDRAPLSSVLPRWARLYAGLARRHDIRGPADFSPAYFDHLAASPAYETFVARVDGRIVAMAIWFQHGAVAVNHLGASDAEGYAAGATYALYDAAIQHFADAERLDLGGAAGLAEAADDGLARFKRGFANASASAYLCGAVLDQARYDELSAGRDGAFFPAYRG